MDDEKVLTDSEVAESLELFFADNPERWTQDAYAKGVDGLVKNVGSPHAVCWCLVGACMLAFPNDIGPALCALEARVPTNRSIQEWNDSPDRTFADVQALLRRMQGK